MSAIDSRPDAPQRLSGDRDAVPPGIAPVVGDPDREAAARALQTQLLNFKRTLHMIRTGSSLHQRATAAGVPVLGLLKRGGPQRTTAIAAEFCLDPSTVSRQVDALVRSGHVEKVRDPDDGRAMLVQLTDLGTTELHEHVRAINATLNGILDGWTVADLHTLTTLLGRLNDDVYARFAPTSTPQENQ